MAHRPRNRTNALLLSRAQLRWWAKHGNARGSPASLPLPSPATAALLDRPHRPPSPPRPRRASLGSEVYLSRPQRRLRRVVARRRLLEPHLELAHHLDEPLEPHEPLAVVGPVGGGDGHVDLQRGGGVARRERLAELRELREDLGGDLVRG